MCAGLAAVTRGGRTDRVYGPGTVGGSGRVLGSKLPLGLQSVVLGSSSVGRLARGQNRFRSSSCFVASAGSLSVRLFQFLVDIGGKGFTMA